MIFLDLFNRLIKKKDVYFKYSEEEQFTGDYWVDGKQIYTKTVKYNGNESSNINSDIDLGISQSSVNEIWIDSQNSFVYFGNGACGPLYTVSKSGWFGVYAYLINIANTSQNIKLNIQSNSNTAVKLVYITVRYTKK